MAIFNSYVKLLEGNYYNNMHVNQWTDGCTEVLTVLVEARSGLKFPGGCFFWAR